MKQQINNTALYLRLSRDDENYGDSVSIETQRTILRQFVKDNGFHVVDEYVDDGWTGTNFDRPAFKRMIEDVESGRINCIITKDLSRFGREHVMMGYYLEFYFVEKNVRYIAVSDGEDTEKGLSDFVPFKNLFNEWYAKDTSRKIKASMNAKFKAGERTCAYAPLGYKKHPEIKNKLAVDEETKWIIEKIYEYALLGNGAGKITKMLIEEKVPTPGYINYKRDGTFANIYAGALVEKSYAWTIAQVKSILKDETYIGNTVHYRESNVSYKNKHRVRKDKSEWLRIENTHEPIISKEDFEKVQQMIASRRRTQKEVKETQIFAGIVKCADCGWSLGYSINTSAKVPYHYYKCSRYSQLGKKHCTNHYIRYDTLYAYVLSRLQYWAAQAQMDEDKLLKKLKTATDKESGNIRRKQENDLKRAEKRKKELDGLFARLYEDFVSGKITEYNFNMLSEKYQTEQAELEEKIKTLGGELNTAKKNESNAEKWLDLIKQYSDISELTAPLLNALIEKIAVHQAVNKDDGTIEQEVEIYYRFIGKIE
ncbi:MAG: recombinase family protein [Eubacterium sp.]|nr:recombinase family protein [Eubacterium sp.]